MTYAQHISEITSLVESAILNYDYMVLTEAADDEAGVSKIKAAGNAILNTIKIAIKKLMAFIGKVCATVAKIIKAFRGRVTLEKDIEVPAMFVKLPKEHVSAIHSAVLDGSFSADVALSSISKLSEQTGKIPAGTTINLKEHDKLLNFCGKILVECNRKIDSISKSEKGSDKLTKINNLIKGINTIITNINNGSAKVMAAATPDKPEPKKREVADDKVKVVEESADDFSNRELAAHCLIEAAQLLRESSDLPQDDIDEIPEEKPEVAPEYPETTSGGDELPEDHLEDTKELVNDDKEAMDILTKDEDSKIITEAINLIFDL